MSSFQVPVKVSGNATVEVPDGLTDAEQSAAEDMSELVATALLLSINSHQLADENSAKMREYASRHGIPPSRAKEIFKSIWVSNVKADTTVGPMDMEYNPG